MVLTGFVESPAITEFLITYGYLALFLIFILEGAMLLYFAPSESILPLAILSPLANSIEDYVFVIVIAVCGATIGQYTLFFIARRAGREYLLEKPWLPVTDSQVTRFDHWFNRWGPIAIPVSNTLLFTRGMLTVPVGLADMKDTQFVVLSALGTVSYGIFLTVATLGLLEALV